MRTVRFDPKELTDPEQKAWWDDWLKEAADARVKILEDWEAWLALDSDPRPPFRPVFKEEVWKKLKKWLLKHIFHDRCAYCESPLEFDRYKGDAEHYRPKGSITWRDDLKKPKIKARCVLPDGKEIDHPGYFWLAYDWRNLVPACSACNSGKGKVDQFPVQHAHLLQLDAVALGPVPAVPSPDHETIEVPEKSKRYFLGPLPLDLKEEPLLLNPLNPSGERDPKRHLRYGVAGVVVAVDDSQLGKNSMRVYQLEREQLRLRRQRAQEDMRRQYYSKKMEPPGPAIDSQLQQILDRYRSGQEDFSTAALDHLRADQQRLDI